MSVVSGPKIEFLIANTARVKKEHEALGMVWPPLAVASPLLEIEPYDPQLVGPNSYDLHLGKTLSTYVNKWVGLDPKKNNPTESFEIPEEGWTLNPGVLYLGTTVERTWCAGLVPWVDGRSSIGRLGLQIHMTAGRGDDHFNGQWTLEMACIHPVRVYPGMRIAQITFFNLDGARRPYKGRYQNQEGATASRYHEKLEGDK